MPSIEIEYTAQDIKKLILADLAEKMPGKSFTDNDIHIEVKTSQNYRAEWETGQFRGRVKTY